MFVRCVHVIFRKYVEILVRVLNTAVAVPIIVVRNLIVEPLGKYIQRQRLKDKNVYDTNAIGQFCVRNLTSAIDIGDHQSRLLVTYSNSSSILDWLATATRTWWVIAALQKIPYFSRMYQLLILVDLLIMSIIVQQRIDLAIRLLLLKEMRESLNGCVIAGSCSSPEKIMLTH